MFVYPLSSPLLSFRRRLSNTSSSTAPPLCAYSTTRIVSTRNKRGRRDRPPSAIRAGPDRVLVPTPSHGGSSQIRLKRTSRLSFVRRHSSDPSSGRDQGRLAAPPRLRHLWRKRSEGDPGEPSTHVPLLALSGPSHDPPSDIVPCLSQQDLRACRVRPHRARQPCRTQRWCCARTEEDQKSALSYARRTAWK